jgi:glyoxylase-like metal-dependent hydrolase (beta-lactamase superfamily II)
VSTTNMTVGVASALSPLVRRIVAPNPGPMTGPGTNTYLVGIDEVAVLDPGPADEAHIEAILGAAMPDRVRWVVLTHTHPDHWPAARAIVERTGAQLAAFGRREPKADEFDLDVAMRLEDAAVLDGTEWSLHALHTPGHAPNHLCFLLEQDRTLFTGDHVLNGTTTVVNPRRGGDMSLYLASCRRLRALPRLARICPAHGDVIEEPYAKIDEYLAHRTERERQIVVLLGEGPQRVKDIVARLYTETPDELQEMAARQVHAHLLKLRDDGRADGSSVRGRWSLRS